MGKSWSSWLKDQSAERMKQCGISSDYFIDVIVKLPFTDLTGELFDQIEKGTVTFKKFRCVTMGSKEATIEFMRGVMNNAEGSASFPKEVGDCETWNMARKLVDGKTNLHDSGAKNKFEMIDIEDGSICWVLSAWNKSGYDRLDFFVGYVVMHGIKRDGNEFRACEELLAAQLIRNNGLGWDAKNKQYRYLST